MTFDNLNDVVGSVISEHPYVKVLNKPVYDEIELLPGISTGRWTALAQVDGALAFIELRISQHVDTTQ
jgi:hypothetical protein